MKKVLIAFVKLYQKIFGPYTTGSCRFHPSCSNYSLEALEKHGALKGTWLTLKRLLRCHPFHPGGHDPIP